MSADCFEWLWIVLQNATEELPQPLTSVAEPHWLAVWQGVERGVPVKLPQRPTAPETLRDALATAEVLFSLGQREAQAIVSGFDEDGRTDAARSITAAVLQSLWAARASQSRHDAAMRQCVVSPAKRYSGLVERMAGALASMTNPRAGFLAGQLYTALLPDRLRKDLGAYYTPPPLVDRLLVLAENTGVDWSSARIVDPACGGAAFLASVAPKMVASSVARKAELVLRDIEGRLLGIEVDDFAAWMSMVMLDLALIDLTAAAGRSLEPLVIARDSFRVSLQELGHFDLVVGNPPYGKVTLAPPDRERFKQSLFGHANLYGVFTELAVRLAKPGGLISYVTPTSFLGGEYFKNLRRLLCKEAPLAKLDFVSDREGVFDGVLQETMLAVFRRGGNVSRRVEVNLLHLDDITEPVLVERVGSTAVNLADGGAWLLPRSRSHARLIEACNTMPHRLADYGFAVSTGQLVWNRHKTQLRSTCERHCYPIIWAEAVNADGTFHFQAAKRSHLPYLKLESGQDFLLNQEPCILVQRTTAKEQKRRLIAAVIPNSFVVEYPGFVVENHLNMIYSLAAKPSVALRTVAALVNSRTLDQVFRCINGSVAVSAYELNSLPLPGPEQMQKLQHAIAQDVNSNDIEALIAGFYTLNDERNTSIAAGHSSEPSRRVAA